MEVGIDRKLSGGLDGDGGGGDGGGVCGDD